MNNVLCPGGAYGGCEVAIRSQIITPEKFRPRRAQGLDAVLAPWHKALPSFGGSGTRAVQRPKRHDRECDK